jgi:hypothetical protein
MEPSEGRYEWEWLDHAIEQAAKKSCLLVDCRSTMLSGQFLLPTSFL